ncbi:MAG: hypothetical protein JXR36_09650 [Bacteroidales bacterium]|nr:hypothetical protein [Bacteroidales bacterium]
MDNKIFLKKHFGILSGLAIMMLKVVLALLGINFTIYFSNLFFGIFGVIYFLFLQKTELSFENHATYNFLTIIIISLLFIFFIGLKLYKSIKKYESSNIGLRISLLIAMWFIQIFVSITFYSIEAIFVEHLQQTVLFSFINNYSSIIIELVIPTMVIVFIGYKFDKKTKIENDQQNLS